MPVSKGRSGKLELFVCNCKSPSLLKIIGNETSKIQKFKYPLVRRDVTAFEHYHGVDIADPYRWLEDVDSEETKQFIQLQNDLSRSYINSCKYREAIMDKITKLWNFEKYSTFYRYGDYYFFMKNSGLENQSVVYMQDTLNSTPRILLNPNKLSEDGDVALCQLAFSKDGKFFAYTLSTSGSDWETGYIINVKTGEEYSDVLKKIKFSTLQWTHDNVGFFYACYPDTEGNMNCKLFEKQQLYYHKVGTAQQNDIFIYKFGDPLLRINAEVSDCGSYLICRPRKSCKDNMLYFYDISQNGITFDVTLIPIVEELKNDYFYVTTEGSVNYFRTNWNAANYHLVAIDFNNASQNNWQVSISEHDHDVLNWVTSTSQNLLLVCYIRDVVNVLQLFDLKGTKIYEFPLKLGTIVDYFAEKRSTELFFKFQSFLTPGIIYRCDLTNTPYQLQVIKESNVKEFNPSFFEVKQVFYKSYDGTKIPMFIVHRQDAPLDGTQPCLLDGYGGFSISVQPSFNIPRLVFVNNLAGIYAVANIRGGGEYGEKWHEAGRQRNKQNSFDDFQAAADYLISRGYTRPNLLTIQGASNGGLLVAACINQRPDLFGCAICQFGVLDMLKFNKFTIGHTWCSDYGSVEGEDDFKTLLRYSPLHNTHVPTTVQYPAILLLTADRDGCVVPSHSFKFAAQIQYMASKSDIQENPIFLYVETGASDNSGKPTSKRINEAVDILCFIVQSLNLKFQT